MNKQKRVLAIHDISCFGRCSLTVALPIFSATGIETTVLPTAVLSTHTGGFSNFTFRDLTQDINPILAHWQTEKITFDALYTGFLGSFEQLEIVSNICDLYKKQGTIIAVDPVMADNGTLYSLFSADFPVGMKRLCQKADMITPNITEALLLLKHPYQAPPYNKAYIEDILRQLSALGPKQVVLTGISLDAKTLGVACYDRMSDQVWYVFADRIEGSYHGTGDVYASAFLSSMLCGRTLHQASKIAVDFTVESILRTKQAGTDIRFGVNFEAGLGDLAKIIAQPEKYN